MKKKSVRSDKPGHVQLARNIVSSSSKQVSDVNKKQTSAKIQLKYDISTLKGRTKTDNQTQSSEEYRLVTQRSHPHYREEEEGSLTATPSLQEVLQRQVEYLHGLQSSTLSESRQLFSRSTSSRLELFQQRLLQTKPSAVEASQHRSQQLFAAVSESLTRTNEGAADQTDKSFARLAAAYISHEVTGKCGLLNQEHSDPKEAGDSSKISQFKEILKKNKEAATIRLKEELAARKQVIASSEIVDSQETGDPQFNIYPKRLDHAESESVVVPVSDAEDVRLENSPTFKLQQPQTEFVASPVKILPKQLPMSLNQFKTTGELYAGPNIATSNVFSAHTFGARDSLPTLHGAGRLALGASLVSVEGGSARDGKDLLQMLGGELKKKQSSGSMEDVVEEQPTPFDEKLEQVGAPPSHRSVKSHQQNLTPKSSKRPNSSRSSKLADGIDLVSKIDLKQLHQERGSSKLNSPESFDQFQEGQEGNLQGIEQIGSTDRDVDRELNHEVVSTKNVSKSGVPRSEKPSLHPSSPQSATPLRSDASLQRSQRQSTSSQNPKIPTQKSQQDAENLWLHERIRILTLENAALASRVEFLEKDRSSLIETFNLNLHEVETDALRWKAAAGVLQSKIEQLESVPDPLEPLSDMLPSLKLSAVTLQRTLELYDKGLVSEAREAHVQTALALKGLADTQKTTENCSESLQLTVSGLLELAQALGAINLKMQQLLA